MVVVIEVKGVLFTVSTVSFTTSVFFSTLYPSCLVLDFAVTTSVLLVDSSDLTMRERPFFSGLADSTTFTGVSSFITSVDERTALLEDSLTFLDADFDLERDSDLGCLRPPLLLLDFDLALPRLLLRLRDWDLSSFSFFRKDLMAAAQCANADAGSHESYRPLKPRQRTRY